MKIAISTDGDMVSPHFGRCPQFTIIEVKNGELAGKKIIENPGHHPNFLPRYLGKMGINCIIAGGMGMRAKGHFNREGIKTILGVEGKVEEAIAGIKDGSLKGSEGICKPGMGKGYGIEKTEI
ncbi:MAG: NifB/NifX family molybdenum-iron cluster-binding protein [Actinomycetota bacterium]|nr:NifB/NifX family molybdenum-iron cluster-binding protein [Actinomycetota bacterium]